MLKVGLAVTLASLIALYFFYTSSTGSIPPLQLSPLAEQLVKETTAHHKAGNLQKAIESGEMALAVIGLVNSPDHPDIGRWLNRLSFLHRSANQPDKAEVWQQRALRINEEAAKRKATPDATLELIISLHGLAEIRGMQGRLAEAEPLLKRMLSLREKHLPAGHPDIASGYRSLIGLYRMQGRNSEADQLLKHPSLK